MMIVILFAAFFVALRAQDACGDSCGPSMVCVEDGFGGGTCEWPNCANYGGDPDTYCEQNNGAEYYCYTDEWNPSYAWCNRKRCLLETDCTTNVTGVDLYCNFDYQECYQLCTGDQTSSTCPGGEVCITSQCQQETCANYGGDPDAYCSGNGPNYECYQDPWGPSAWCQQRQCSNTADCETAIGAGWVCNNGRTPNKMGECVDGCLDNTECSGGNVCDPITSICEFECANTTECQNRYNNEFACNDMMRCERVPYCLLYGCDWEERNGYEAVCNLTNGWCSTQRCWNDTDCSVGYFCDNDYGRYEGECVADCNNRNGTSFCQSRRDIGYECLANGRCENRCIDDAECKTRDDTLKCMDWGQCEIDCNLMPSYFCEERYNDASFICSAEGSCDRLRCESDNDAFCESVNSLFTCAYDECQVGCFNNTYYCQTRWGGFNVAEICTDQGICGRQECRDIADCPDGLGCMRWPNDYRNRGECEEACTSDESCRYRYGWGANPAGWVCNLDQAACEYECATTSECQEMFGENMVCNNQTLRCDEIPWCVYEPQCELFGAVYGVELYCNETSGDCEPVECTQATVTTDCTTAGVDECVDLSMLFEGEGISEVCGNLCSSNQECMDRLSVLGNMTMDGEFPVFFCHPLGICYPGESCNTDDDCMYSCDSDERCQCVSGGCRPFTCSSDTECWMEYGNTTTCKLEYGRCVENDCEDATDCTEPENACFTQIPWEGNRCYRDCTTETTAECQAAYGGDTDYECKILRTGSILEGSTPIPSENIYVCINETLPGENMTTTTTSTTTEEPTTTTANQCIKNVNYVIDGQSCGINGDPRFITWDGVSHDFQGQPNTGKNLFYYLTPCYGVAPDAMPFKMAVEQVSLGGSSITGVDYVLLELLDVTGTYYVYISGDIAGMIAESDLPGTSILYDDVSADVMSLDPDMDYVIGNRFNVRYTESFDFGVRRVDAVLTIDGECTLEFFMEGQGNFGNGRNRMQRLFIAPPECYKCRICGLCGDFKSPPKNMLLETCTGGLLPIVPGIDNGNAFAYDINGNTWEREYCSDRRRRRLVDDEYVSTVGDNFVYVDACDDAIRGDVEMACMYAREIAACCDIDGFGDLCNTTMTNCFYDACALCEGDSNAINASVAAIFDGVVNLACSIPAVFQSLDPENVVAEVTLPGYEPTGSPTMEPTDGPTENPTMEPTKMETTTVIADGTDGGSRVGILGVMMVIFMSMMFA